MQRGWLPHREGFLKINTDAAVCNDGSFLSVVVRNDGGTLVEAHSFKATIQDPTIAKLWAIRQAFLICVKNGWKKVCCETDAKNVVHMLNDDNSNYHWSAVSMLKEILQLRGLFVCINFSWRNRFCNRPAHEIAK